MNSLLVIADTINGAYASRADALQKYAPQPWSVDVVHYDQRPLASICWHRYDVAFVLPPPVVPMARRLISESRSPCKIVASHNSGPGRREAELFRNILVADHTIINNYAAWLAAKEGIRDEHFRATHVSNGVDLSLWGVDQERPRRVLWITNQRKTEEEAGRTDVKGWRDVARPLRTLLDNVPGWEHDFRIVQTGAPGMSQADLRAWYNSGRYFLVSSVTEGTPNTLLEAMACGCIPITTPVGNATELIAHGVNGMFFSERSAGGAYDAMVEADENHEAMAVRSVITIQEWDWRFRVEDMFAVFRCQ